MTNYRSASTMPCSITANSGPSRAAKVLQRLLGHAANGTITDAVIAGARPSEALPISLPISATSASFS